VKLPTYTDRAKIHQRLQVIFPEGVPQRIYCVREAAASTVFVMLYIGAVEGTGEWAAPKQIVRMTNAQAASRTDNERIAYASRSLQPGFQPRGKTWYRENSREQIRDETIRQGLITNNAVVERTGLATTSAKPRYALRADFAALFDPALSAQDLEKAAETWREQRLSASARARIALLRRGAATAREGILVTFPNGEARRMAPGPSSVISKAVIEEFAEKFLLAPAVLWVSESGLKVVARDDRLAAQIKLKISPDRNLPDIVLADLGSAKNGDVLLVFVEVVATDGPVTRQRQEALLKIATDAGFSEQRVAFVTAFLDRSHPAFKKTVAELAWNSFVWFAAEPENLLVLHAGNETIVKSLAAWM
jgi:BsuBI/PstI restriction endonuclease domain/BsuBI/PstI restriction endonuclease HTH domain